MWQPGPTEALASSPQPLPTATSKQLLPRAKELCRVQVILVLVQALSGGLHEASQPFARQRLALRGNKRAVRGEIKKL